MSPRALRGFGLAMMAVGLLALGWYSLGDRTSARQEQVLTDLAEIAPPSPDAADDFPAIVDTAVRDPSTRSTPIGATFTIVDVLPHDTAAFTQGLELDGGRLFESTGLVESSSIRELDPTSGEVLRQQAVPDVFAEGLTIVGDEVLQLTWRDGVAYRYDRDSFELVDSHTYETEGWGLCFDGAQLVMSDGTPTLQFRDPQTFALLGTIDVTFSGTEVDELNELECVNGRVWANIWKSSLIIEVDPVTGAVTTVLNARTLTPPSVDGSQSAVLNGIAYDETDGTFLLTGKLWPSIFRVRIDALGQ